MNRKKKNKYSDEIEKTFFNKFSHTLEDNAYETQTREEREAAAAEE